ncbi:hypothetical protein C8Q74DRAFT_1222810 [Fomes fomentarius]|nr:hypothetical protein C8Q74DRAFT_1222810 [Fomes fomentarius]
MQPICSPHSSLNSGDLVDKLNAVCSTLKIQLKEVLCSSVAVGPRLDGGRPGLGNAHADYSAILPENDALVMVLQYGLRIVWEVRVATKGAVRVGLIRSCDMDIDLDKCNSAQDHTPATIWALHAVDADQQPHECRDIREIQRNYILSPNSYAHSAHLVYVRSCLQNARATAIFLLPVIAPSTPRARTMPFIAVALCDSLAARVVGRKEDDRRA